MTSTHSCHTHTYGTYHTRPTKKKYTNNNPSFRSVPFVQMSLRFAKINILTTIHGDIGFAKCRAQSISVNASSKVICIDTWNYRKSIQSASSANKNAVPPPPPKPESLRSPYVPILFIRQPFLLLCKSATFK